MPRADQLLLELLLNRRSQDNLVLRLFANDRYPGEVKTSDELAEVIAEGYGTIPLAPQRWVLFPGKESVLAQYPTQTFTFREPAGPVYGYYVTQQTSGDLLWCGRLKEAPFISRAIGDEVSITLARRMRQIRRSED